MPFFITAEHYSTVYMYIFPVCSSSLAEGRLGCFHFPAVVNRAAINMAEPLSVALGAESFPSGSRKGVLWVGHRYIYFRLLGTVQRWLPERLNWTAVPPTVKCFKWHFSNWANNASSKSQWPSHKNFHPMYEKPSFELLVRVVPETSKIL